MQDIRVHVVASSCASLSGKVRQLFQEHTLVGKRTALPGEYPVFKTDEGRVSNGIIDQLQRSQHWFLKFLGF